MKKSISIAAMMFLTIVSHAQEPAALNGKYVIVNGVSIYYEESGQGEPLILLHGFGQTSSIWKDFVVEYSKQYRVIAWDSRGHGRSNNPDTSIVYLHATVALDLLGFMNALHLDKVKVIGHSSGGITILYAASMEPEGFEAIIPISAQCYYSTQVREFITQNDKPKRFYQFMELERKHGKTKGTLLAKQFYHFADLQGDPAITPDQLARIKARTLIILGDNDFIPVAQAFEMYQNIPKARLWISPNGWHEPQAGANQVDFIRRTSEFLEGEWNKVSR